MYIVDGPQPGKDRVSTYNTNDHKFRLRRQQMYARLGIDRFTYKCTECGMGIFSEYDFVEERHTLSPPKDLPPCQT